MSKWLVKTEPGDYSIDDLKRDSTTLWVGVRNYQARNYLLEMKVGDEVLFYHSNAEPSGVVGVCKVAEKPEPDKTQFDQKSIYFDEKATKEKPRWFCPKLRFVKKFNKLIPLSELRTEKGLQKMGVLQKGSRLSVLPVTEAEFKIVLRLAQ